MPVEVINDAAVPAVLVELLVELEVVGVMVELMIDSWSCMKLSAKHPKT
jgi:hypothetical protein